MNAKREVLAKRLADSLMKLRFIESRYSRLTDSLPARSAWASSWWSKDGM